MRARVYTINGLSAHADQQGLVDWLRGSGDGGRAAGARRAEEPGRAGECHPERARPESDDRRAAKGLRRLRRRAQSAGRCRKTSEPPARMTVTAPGPATSHRRPQPTQPVAPSMPSSVRSTSREDSSRSGRTFAPHSLEMRQHADARQQAERRRPFAAEVHRLAQHHRARAGAGEGASLRDGVADPPPEQRVPQRVEEVARVAARQVDEIDAVELCDESLVVRRRRVDDHHRRRFDAEAAEVTDAVLGRKRGVLGRRRRRQDGDAQRAAAPQPLDRRICRLRRPAGGTRRRRRGQPGDRPSLASSVFTCLHYRTPTVLAVGRFITSADTPTIRAAVGCVEAEGKEDGAIRQETNVLAATADSPRRLEGRRRHACRRRAGRGRMQPADATSPARAGPTTASSHRPAGTTTPRYGGHLVAGTTVAFGGLDPQLSVDSYMSGREAARLPLQRRPPQPQHRPPDGRQLRAGRRDDLHLEAEARHQVPQRRPDLGTRGHRRGRRLQHGAASRRADEPERQAAPSRLHRRLLRDRRPHVQAGHRRAPIRPPSTRSATQAMPSCPGGRREVGQPPAARGRAAAPTCSRSS